MLEKLFETAEKIGGIEYIYSLVRVEGFSNSKDALIKLNSLVQRTDDTAENYRECLENKEPLKLLVNLLNCASRKTYKMFPFLHLRKGNFPHFKEPTVVEIAKDAASLFEKTEFIDIGQRILNLYATAVSVDQINTSFRKLKEFLKEILSIYFRTLLKFNDLPKFYKMPGFEVVEFLTGDSGLEGFKIYFSNGNSATFARSENETKVLNIMMARDTSVGFQVGMLDELTKKWRVGDKWLYEIGLPGRYNRLGEWKPLAYPGGGHEIDKEILSLTDDPLVQGCLLYIMCTCHRGTEFVITTNINIPYDDFSFGNIFHLYKCQNIEETKIPRNSYIYDGWWPLDSIDPESIKHAIAMIGIGSNRIAFAYNAKVQWTLKYHNKPKNVSCAEPSQEDLAILNKMFKDFPVSSDAIFLDASIEWFNRGRSSQNKFVSFLCYYLSFELLAVAIAEGKADFGFPRVKIDTKSVEKLKIECIEKKLRDLYENNPIEFVRTSYFDCVESLRKKTQKVAEWAFGPDHEYVKSLFVKKDGHSLSSLRGNLAHGVSGLVDRDIEIAVEQRCPELGIIIKSFLTRIIFNLKPEELLPKWSGQHSVSVETSDPRATHVVSHLDIISTKDWRIRPEWIEEL